MSEARLARTQARRRVVVLYSATLAVSAGLVFMLQPMFARFVLPMLGGTPAVWTTAMLFFQTVLLLAYVYAHWSTHRLGARRQAALHMALVAAALLVLPIGVPDGWTPPAGGSPIPWLLLLLVVAVGLPFFVVSSTAPLLQSWLASTDHPDADDPYFLYRASNLGSVLGLVAYPLLVEPRLTLGEQSWLWSGGFALLWALLVGCAVVLWRARPAPGARPVPGADPASGADAPPAERLTRSRRLRWIALGFVPSSLMLGATTALTTNVAPVPLLWVLPLSLYLGSFIVVFSRGKRRATAHRAAALALPPLAVLLAGVIVLQPSRPLWLVAAIHLAAFFVVALVCHGELAKDRPSTAHLTRFYVLMSVGGALGGAFNVIVAPFAFDSLTEYPIALVLACFLIPLGRGSWSDSASIRAHLLPPLALGIAVYVALTHTADLPVDYRVVYAVAAIACIAMARHPLRFGLAMVAIMAGAWLPMVGNTVVIHQERSFFGVHKVEETQGAAVHELRHGTTLHGAQIGGIGIDPTTYYHRTGPMGQLMRALPDPKIARRAGVVGLGTGAMACLSRPGDRWTFFEIDPSVERIARDNELFSFLRDCKGSFDVVLGDGRRSLERRPRGEFGLLVLDAFSSDAIPVHLVTRQALEIYEGRLAPGGVMAFHISNKYLDLEPVLGNLARAAGLTCYGQRDTNVTARHFMKTRSHWVTLAREPAHLGAVTGNPLWHPCATDAGERPWSDDYANVLGTLEWR
ncbi:MAG TPA: fused MFS/spermidine synthase [Thermoleophilaceae bacterium]